MHLILEAPFYNLKKATQFYFVLSPTFLIKYPFRTDLLIDKVASPVTFFHGDQDKTTSFDHSKELFKLVNSQQKEFVSIPTATHHNVKDYKIYYIKNEINFRVAQINKLPLLKFFSHDYF